MVLKRIGVVSLGKVSFAAYALIGFIVGAVITIAAVLAGGITPDGGGLESVMFGVGAIILWPLVYGVLGFVGGVIGGWLYNVAAGTVGGVDLQLE